MNDSFCDIHTHLLESPVGENIGAVLAQARAKGLEFLVTATESHDQWRDTLHLANGRTVFAALGIHPFHPHDWNDDRAQELDRLIADHPHSVKAVGEIGLDFQDGRDTAAAQLAALAAQIEIARRHKLPVILHNRKSWPDFFGLIRDLHIREMRGVCHCFNGSEQIADKCLALGLHLSFAGTMTYPNANRLRRIAAMIPPDRILVETDTPFLPAHGVERDHSLPQDVRAVIAAIARTRGVETEHLARQILANARRLLDIDPQYGSPPNLSKAST